MINEKLSQSTTRMNMKITVFSLSVSLSAFLCAHFPQFYIPAREPRLGGEGRRRINHRVPNQVYISTHSNQIIPKICKAYSLLTETTIQPRKYSWYAKIFSYCLFYIFVYIVHAPRLCLFKHPFSDTAEAPPTIVSRKITRIIKAHNLERLNRP